jgi:hypothetical protein
MGCYIRCYYSLRCPPEDRAALQGASRRTAEQSRTQTVDGKARAVTQLQLRDLARLVYT